MEFEDSRFALFPEPNAYIQNFEKNKDREIKKIIFQEPYETLPQFHLNNNFTKHNSDCVKNSKGELYSNNNHEKGQQHSNRSLVKHNNHNCNCNQDITKSSGLNFDIKSLLPLLNLFNKGGGTDLSQMVGLLNNGNKDNSSQTNPLNLISTLFSNKDMMSGILKFFKSKDKNKVEASKKDLKTTDFEIRNYTRVN